MVFTQVLSYYESCFCINVTVITQMFLLSLASTFTLKGFIMLQLYLLLKHYKEEIPTSISPKGNKQALLFSLLTKAGQKDK